ncbi:prohormone-1 [Nilaparvata lugens]|uniref:prohormone-1 n=1 Tax=Nilaparvata lugens TaxID=108931 RepID=UPI00193CA9E9|nr:prohormone-1 [Nilaparvata lugens]
MLSQRLVAVFVAIFVITWCCIQAAPSEKERLLNELEFVDDDGSIDAALMNYLFAKQMVNRLRSQMDISDLQKKRSYWKQCAFNAVSCFGK